MDGTWNLQLVFIIGQLRRALSNHHLIKFSSDLDSTRQLDVFAALTVLQESPNGVDMVECHVAQLGCDCVYGGTNNPPNEGYVHRLQRLDGNYEAVLTFCSVLSKPIVRK